MNKNFVFLVILILSACSGKKQLDNPFYAFNNCMRTMQNCPTSTQEQVELVHRLEYEALGGHESVDLVSLKRELDSRGLQLPEIYTGIYLRNEGVVLPENWHHMLSLFKDTETVFALHIHADGQREPNQNTDGVFVQKFKEMADQAEQFGVQLAIYPHYDFYCETTDHALKLVGDVNHPRFGMTLNLCHLLKVEGEIGWEQQVEKLIPHLKMVSIHGADGGDTKNMGWERLIQPLGEGSFDTFRFVKHLRDHGYTGTFGLQCFNIQQDCEEALTKSKNAWDTFKIRYADS